MPAPPPILARPPPPHVRVVDDALPPALFGRLARAVRGLGTENLRRTYQTTYWFDLGSPSSLPEAAIVALRPHVPGELAGAEWWLSRMRTSDVCVDFHRDRDEARFARTGRTVHPAVSSVLFLNRCRGGLLAVVDVPPAEANPACAPDLTDVDLVRPWPNRFAVFRGDATHGVLDANGDVPHGRLARPTPLRLAIAINWWKRRPESVPEFATSRRYPALRLRSDLRARATRRVHPAPPAPASYTAVMWQKCSVCKKPIPYGGTYLKCAVSTCNRKRFQLYFCSDECWDAHNPDQNHRNPAYTEHVAPKAP